MQEALGQFHKAPSKVVKKMTLESALSLSYQNQMYPLTVKASEGKGGKAGGGFKI